MTLDWQLYEAPPQLILPRFERKYQETADVPGQAMGKKRTQYNTPRNCRRLLPVQPPGYPVLDHLPYAPEMRERALDEYTFYQKDGIRWAAPRSGVWLCWAAGSGKTRPALHTALLDGGPIVWITLPVAKTQVASEIKEVSKVDAKVVWGRGGDDDKIDWDARVNILNWEILPYRLDELLDKAAHTRLTVVFDEIHEAKDWKRSEKAVDGFGNVIWKDLNSQAACAARLARKVHRRIGLTATPIRNTRMDLWSQWDIIEPGCAGDSYAWADRYCDAKPGKYGGRDTSGTSNNEELNARLKEVMHIVKAEVARADLPGIKRRIIYIAQQDQCRPKGSWAGEVKAAAKQGKEALFAAKRAEAGARKRKWITEYISWCEENKYKVVVLTGLRLDTEGLGMQLKEEINAPGWFAHGGMPVEQRTACVAAFMKSPGPCWLVGTGDSFGTALNIQDTDKALFSMLPWNGGQIEQWEGRFVRRGQKRQCEVLYLIAEGTVEDGIVEEVILPKLEQLRGMDLAENPQELRAALAGEGSEEEILDRLLSWDEEE